MTECIAPRRRLFALACVWIVWSSLSAASGQETLETLPMRDLSSFRAPDANWHIAGGVVAPLEGGIEILPGRGVLVSVPESSPGHLLTTWEHGDLLLDLEFLLPAGSNSGIYLQGRYEVQLFDSWGVREPTFSDVGGIFQRWDPAREEGAGGVPPLQNAGRAPGLWQHLEIDFRAPRFDAQGRKVRNARFDRVALNGVVIHENVVVRGPTRAAMFANEAPVGPLMIQGNDGPVALRHVRYKRYGDGRVRLTDLTYRLYEGTFPGPPDLTLRRPLQEGSLDGFRPEVVASLDTFAARFDGTLSVPATGTYRFDLELGWGDEDPHFQENPNGGALLLVDGDIALAHDGGRPTATGAVVLEAGDHAFQLLAYKNVAWLGAEMRLAVEGPDTRRQALNAEATASAPQFVAPIQVDPEGRTRLLRHMVDVDTTRLTHALSVGSPEGTHYTVDLDSGALLRAWRGPFLDATPMWYGRGYNQLAVPRGSVVTLNTAFAIETAFEHDRYELDPSGLPTFHYRIDGVAVTDRIEPVLDGRALRRTVTADGRIELRTTPSSTIERRPDGTFSIDDGAYLLRFEDASDVEVRAMEGGSVLVIRVASGALIYTILW